MNEFSGLMLYETTEMIAGSFDLPDPVRTAMAVVANGWPVLAIHRKSKTPCHPASQTGIPNHREFWLRTQEAVEEAYLNAVDPWSGRVGCQFAVMTGVPNHNGWSVCAIDHDRGDLRSLINRTSDPAAVRRWLESTAAVRRVQGRGHYVGVHDGPVPATHHLIKDEDTAIEWRGDGGYIMLPDSRHATGQLYQLTRDEPALPVPAALLELARQGGVRAVSTTPSGPVASGSPPSHPIGVGSATDTGSEAYQRVVDLLGDRVAKRVLTGSVMAHCPGPNHAHGDRNPSLSVKDGADRVLLNCFAGCTHEEVVEALGIGVAELYDSPDVSVEFDPKVGQATTTGVVEVDLTIEVGGIRVDKKAFETAYYRNLIQMLAKEKAENDIQIAALDEMTDDQLISGDMVLLVPDLEPLWGTAEAPLTALGQSSIWAGPDGSGKTTMACQYVKGRAGFPGWDVMLGSPVQPLPQGQMVLYVGTDRSRQILQGFKRGMGREHAELLKERVMIWPGEPPFGLDTEAGKQWILRLIERFNVGLLILDSRKDVGDEMDPASVSKISRLVKSLDAGGVEVLVLAHTTQASDSRNSAHLADILGFRGIYSGMGSALILKGDAKKTVRIHQVKAMLETHDTIYASVDRKAGRFELDPALKPTAFPDGSIHPGHLGADDHADQDEDDDARARREIREKLTAAGAAGVPKTQLTGRGGDGTLRRIIVNDMIKKNVITIKPGRGKTELCILTEFIRPTTE